MVIIPFVYDYGMDIYKEVLQLRQKDKHQEAQIIKRNQVINQYWNEKNELIEEKEDCKTTYTVLESTIDNNIEIINEYEVILDEVVSDKINQDRKAEITINDIPNLSTNELISEISTNILPIKKTIKTAYLPSNDKKKNIFAFLRKRN